MFTGARKTRS